MNRSRLKCEIIQFGLALKMVVTKMAIDVNDINQAPAGFDR